MSLTLNRQNRRQAERRIKKGRFPFPEFSRWFVNYLHQNPGYFAFYEKEEVRCNLTGEVTTHTLTEFYSFLWVIKSKSEHEAEQEQEEQRDGT